MSGPPHAVRRSRAALAHLAQHAVDVDRGRPSRRQHVLFTVSEPPASPGPPAQPQSELAQQFAVGPGAAPADSDQCSTTMARRASRPQDRRPSPSSSACRASAAPAPVRRPGGGSVVEEVAVRKGPAPQARNRRAPKSYLSAAVGTLVASANLLQYDARGPPRALVSTRVGGAGRRGASRLARARAPLPSGRNRFACAPGSLDRRHHPNPPDPRADAIITCNLSENGENPSLPNA